MSISYACAQSSTFIYEIMALIPTLLTCVIRIDRWQKSVTFPGTPISPKEKSRKSRKVTKKSQEKKRYCKNKLFRVHTKLESR